MHIGRITESVKGYLKRNLFFNNEIEGYEFKWEFESLSNFNELAKKINSYINTLSTDYIAEINEDIQEKPKGKRKPIIQAHLQKMEHFKNQFCGIEATDFITDKFKTVSDDLLKADFSIWENSKYLSFDANAVNNILTEEYIYALCYYNIKKKLEQQIKVLGRKQCTFEWVSKKLSIVKLYNELKQSRLIDETVSELDFEYIFSKKEILGLKSKVKWTGSNTLLAYLLSELQRRKIIREKKNSWGAIGEKCFSDVSNLRQAKKNYELYNNAKYGDIGKPEDHTLIDQILS